MPIYEYRCLNCKKIFSALVGGGTVKTEEPACPRCSSKELDRLISRVFFKRSEEDRLESLADPSKLPNLDDPKELTKWARKLGHEFRDEIGEDFDESLEELEEEAYREKEKGEEYEEE